ncbi:DUF935 domain-containing protein [Falsiroseomonas sp.]|uniref:DUF935 domain-containing protein n=1 Tax=Falsiroseomonas sp. TaxID=2870721 RepID=UPI003F71BC0D
MAGVLDQFGKPITSRTIRELRGEVATPTLAGVRPVIANHPADGMTPSRLAAVLRAAAQGEGLAYLELAEDIEERDLHYGAVLGTRKRQVSQLPLTVEAASDDPEHIRHADFLREWLATGVLEASLLDLLDGVGKGFSVMEIMWRTEPGLIVPEALVYRPQRWFEVSREDGHTLLLRDMGGDAALSQHKFLVHRHPQKSGLLLRSGLARIAAWAWMYKAFTLRDWAVFCQNYGQPVRIGKYGPEASEKDKEVLYRAVANIAGDCAALIPASMMIEFVEVADKKEGAEIYERRADWLDRQVSKAVLGQTTTTDAISGGHSVSQEHRKVQEDIERADARLVTATLTLQLARLIIAFNFGEQRRYPVLRLGRPDEVPLEQVIAALEKLGPLGLEVEASQVRDRLGFAEPALDAPRIGGRVAAPAPPSTSPTLPPSLQSIRRLVTSRHASAPEPEVIDALTDRLAEDAAGAMAGLTARVRAEFEAATDLPDLSRRLAALDLPPEDLARAIGQGMALAHLAGEAAALDDLA